MKHTRIRPFNTKTTYPEQKLDNDLCQAVVARGRTVVPGLIDAHGHVMALGERAMSLDLSATKSLAEAQEALRRYAAARPTPPWIRGGGWNQEQWRLGRFPAAADIDAIAPGRPVVLTRIDGHAVLANSAAPQDARSQLRNHLLNEQPVSLVGGRARRKRKFRFPEQLATEPILLPSLDSDIRAAFDRLLDLAGVRPVILAEVDDMAMLRLLARESSGVALVPPIVVRDELQSGALVELCRVPNLVETFYAIVQKRRFPNRLLAELLRGDPAPGKTGSRRR